MPLLCSECDLDVTKNLVVTEKVCLADRNNKQSAHRAKFTLGGGRGLIDKMAQYQCI